DMHLDAEPFAEHAARIANAIAAVDRIADRKRMQDGTPVTQRMPAAGGKEAGDVALRYRRADDLHLGGERFAGQTPRRDREHDRFDVDRGRALGPVDGLA